MASSFFAANYSLNSTADFRDWMIKFDTAIRAGGIITSSDSGQLPLYTVNLPTASGHYPVYRIYQFNDALQTSSGSVYIKVEFGAGNTTALPQLRMQVANATNGSGSVVGNGTTRTVIAGTATGADTAPCYFSSTTSRLTFCIWATNQPGASGFFSVERDHDGNGNDTPNYLYSVVGQGTNGGVISQTLPMNPSAAAPTAESQICALAANNSVIMQFNNNIPFSAAVPLAGKFLNPSVCVGLVCSSDLQVGSIINVSHYGQLQRWAVIGQTGTFRNFGNSTTNFVFAMRHE